jgi:hypothetical protein
LFRGVNAVLPTAPPQQQQQQQQQQQTHDDDLCSGEGPVPTPFSPPERWAKARGAFGVRGPVSGCPWEPLSTAELAQGVGRMCIGALLSLEGCTSTGSSCSSDSSVNRSRGDGTVCMSRQITGTVLQQLDLSGPKGAQRQQQKPQGTKGEPQAPTDTTQATSASVAGAAPATGVLWSIDGCPAAALQALHAGACQALRRELAAALESASRLQVRCEAHKQTPALCCL